ncbi:MAG: TlpA family protein disulfide reductase [Sedimentisphaerales bacterium]|nr:TlpA family protein disulfide reductase [Sedimentisphaerales bacterium]
MSQTYNSDLDFIYSQTKINEDYQVEDHYLLHKNIEGYSVPRITININIDKKNNECDIWLYLIEDVKFNPFLSNKDFSVVDIPDKTLVIDYRFNPEEQMRYGEYCYAAVNPDMVQAGLQEAEGLINSLHKTHTSRDSLSLRDSRTGKKAPSLDIQQWLNKPINLNTWPPGKLTIMNFWDIGCSFCTREIPENNELYEWFKEKDVLFFSIHMARKDTDSIIDFIQSPSENPEDFIDINKIQYPVAIDKPGTNSFGWSSATFNKYGIDGIPDYVIIDQEGNVISYERTIKKEDIEKILSGDKDIIARIKKKQKPVRKLNSIPNGLIVENLEPNSQVKGRFFIYREDTPELVLRNIDSDEAIESQWLQHNSMGQAVGELLLSVDTPDWGQTLKGNIAVITEHSQVSELVTILYEISSRSIAKYVSPVIWFGSVQKGKKITRKFMLQGASNHKVSIKEVSVPTDIELEIGDIEQNSNNIVIDCVLSPMESGFQHGNIELLAVNEQGDKQSIKLDYCAFVQK